MRELSDPNEQRDDQEDKINCAQDITVGKYDKQNQQCSFDGVIDVVVGEELFLHVLVGEIKSCAELQKVTAEIAELLSNQCAKANNFKYQNYLGISFVFIEVGVSCSPAGQQKQAQDRQIMSHYNEMISFLKHL